ncbi:MAG: hypothetical protein D6735_14420, partial [Acidobacteria bacterium]
MSRVISRRGLFLLALLSLFKLLLVTGWVRYVEKAPYQSYDEKSLSFADISVFVRSIINFYYNGRYSPHFSLDEYSNIPPSLRKYIDMSDKEAKCVPAHGCCISYSVLLLPGLILHDAFDLDFSFLVKYLHFILNIMIFASTFSMFLSAAVISKTRIVFWSLILIFISTPPLFTSHSFLGNISDTSGYILPLGFFLFYLAFTRDVSPIFAAFSYFIILIISFGKPRFYPLSLIALLVPILSYG